MLDRLWGPIWVAPKDHYAGQALPEGPRPMMVVLAHLPSSFISSILTLGRFAFAEAGNNATQK